MAMDHAEPDYAGELFTQALEIKKDHVGAIMGLALLAAENFDSRAAEMAKEVLKLDPKMVEAQELLAKLALEDNDVPKATEQAQKALEIDKNSVQGRAILATIDWLADKKETQWDPEKRREAMRPQATSSCSIAATKKASRTTERRSNWIRNCTARARRWAST